MANWKLQYRTSALSYTDVVVGPDPATNPNLVVLAAKKAFMAAAERLESIESGAPLNQSWRRELSDLAGYEYVGTSTTNTPTSYKAKLILITLAAGSGGTIDDGPTSPIRSSLPGVQPMTVRSGNSIYVDEDRGATTTNFAASSAAGSAVERKSWRVVLA